MSVLDKNTKVCEYYHKDRGEDWEQVKPKLFNSLSEYRNQLKQEEFNYIFKNGRWYYKEEHKKLFIKVPEKYAQALTIFLNGLATFSPLLALFVSA
jgi:hypothetical protein